MTAVEHDSNEELIKTKLSLIKKRKAMSKNKKNFMSIKIFNINFAVLIISLILALFISCEKDEEETNEGNRIAYENSENWVSLATVTKNVDVFYVYPTVSSNTSGSMDITDTDERALAQGIFDAQASVFESATNVFAPYYRQMSTKVDMTGIELATDTKEFKQGAVDVQDAFDYYINNLNQGRPFIIAGHSQGTMALIELIKNKFGDAPDLRNRMVAAYLIGYTVTDSDLSISGLTAAQDSTDMGVVITYNTQSATSQGGPMAMVGAHCINPLNWKTDDTPAPNELNKGAVFFDDATGTFQKEETNYCGAQIKTITDTDGNTKRVLTTTTISEDLEIGPYSEGVYHRFDYSLWYRNLEQNVSDRINAYYSN